MADVPPIAALAVADPGDVVGVEVIDVGETFLDHLRDEVAADVMAR